ncbi:MAG: FHA domain-containing protein [Nitrospirae bacterium]|nr:FHA domain-containing protein [Nitrospirota bacterium]
MDTLYWDKYIFFFSRSEDEDTSGRTKAMPSIKTGQKEKKVYLTVVEGENFGEEYECKDKETAIGRSSGNDIVIKDEGISRRHCVIEPATSAYVLKDLNSTNGTFLNNKKILLSVVLKHGDKIKVGKTTLQFIIADEKREKVYTLK